MQQWKTPQAHGPKVRAQDAKVNIQLQPPPPPLTSTGPVGVYKATIIANAQRKAQPGRKSCALTQVAMIATSCTPTTTPVLILSWSVAVVDFYVDLCTLCPYLCTLWLWWLLYINSANSPLGTCSDCHRQQLAVHTHDDVLHQPLAQILLYNHVSVAAIS